MTIPKGGNHIIIVLFSSTIVASTNAFSEARASRYFENEPVHEISNKVM